ncbi:MAG: NUDIX domain-containing protein [Alphaproteobacteria bacterium]
MFVDPALRSKLTPLFHLYWRFARGMTLGVRGCVIDKDDRILLIKHGYTPGWHFPGGGVEVGQTLRQALEMELREEANVELTGEPTFLGMHLNDRTSRRDHVAFYAIRAWVQPVAPQPNREIIDHGFFARDALPPDTSRATRDRLAELFDGQPRSEHW